MTLHFERVLHSNLWLSLASKGYEIPAFKIHQSFIFKIENKKETIGRCYRSSRNDFELFIDDNFESYIPESRYSSSFRLVFLLIKNSELWAGNGSPGTYELPVFRSNQEKVGQNVNKGRITRVPYLPVSKFIQLNDWMKFPEPCNKTGKVASRIIIKKNNKWHLSVFMAKIET